MMDEEETKELLIRIDERVKNMDEKINGKFDNLEKRIDKIEKYDPFWKGVTSVAIVVAAFLGIKF